MYFEKDLYTVNEGDATVELTIIASGSKIDNPFKVVVSTYETDPVSATGGLSLTCTVCDLVLVL